MKTLFSVIKHQATLLGQETGCGFKKHTRKGSMFLLFRRFVNARLFASLLFCVVGSGYAQALDYNSFVGRWYGEYSEVVATKEGPEITIRVCGTDEYFSNQVMQSKGTLYLKIEETEGRFGFVYETNFVTSHKVELVGNEMIDTMISFLFRNELYFLVENGRRLVPAELTDDAKKAYDSYLEEFGAFKSNFFTGEVDKSTIIMVDPNKFLAISKDDDGTERVFSNIKTDKIITSCSVK